MTTVELPPRLFPPLAYYRAMAGAERAVVDAAVRYDKRCKAVHRYEIVDARGRLQLTVPLGKSFGKGAPVGDGFPTWNDTLVSTHDDWWRRHRTALESAYGRTPYFEFIIDRFNGVFRSPEDWPSWPTAIDLIREANRVVCECLAIDTFLEYSMKKESLPYEAGLLKADMRSSSFDSAGEPPYWQVRRHIHGFQEGLSVLDIIFNLGPEAILYLRGLI